MIDPERTLMFAEAAAAATVVAGQRAANRAAIAALAQALRTDPPTAVVTCARGSSDHAATFAKYLIETRLGVLVSSASPSISSLYGVPQQLGGALCLAISQSGRSPDLLATVSAARAAGARTLALVNAEATPLAGLADAVLPLYAGPEHSVAATKTYIASLVALVDLVAAWSGDTELSAALDDLPGRLADAWDADWSPLVAGLADARGLYVIGRGLGLGVAQEAALKFKETCGLHAEAHSAAEVRHGPMALIGPDFPLLMFRQADATAASLDAFAAEARALGVPVFVAGTDLPAAATHPALEPIVQIQSFYRAANALAVARGHDPDRSPHLRKITRTT